VTTFTDDFNRADGDPGASWVQVSGTWSIVSQQLSPGSSGATIVIRAATAMAGSDNFAQATIAATTAVSQGVMCRSDGTLANGYLWRNNGTNWGLFKAVSGTFTAIGTTYAAAAAPGDVARVQAVGSTIKGFVNGVERASVTDTAVTSGTSVGIRSMSTSLLRYDDFSAADIGASVTGDAALSATATLTATGTRSTSGNAALAATATLTAAGQRTATSDAALAATATFTADGQRSTTADAGLAATVALSASGTRSTTADAALSATADLTAQGQVTHNADAALNTTATLTAAGTRTTSAAAGLTATAALTATGTTALAGTAGLAATATLTASGTVHSTRGDVTLTAGPPLSPWTAGQGPQRWTAVEAPGPWTAKETP
jgi:hypothetical protein